MNFDIIIIGAGPAGLGLACSLSKTNLKIAVVEKLPKHTFSNPLYDGREIAITHRSVKILKTLGVWSHIPPHSISLVKEARIKDGTSAYFLHFDHKKTCMDSLGYIISNQEIRKALYQKLKKNSNVNLIEKNEVVSFFNNKDFCGVNLQNKKILKGSLIVAADGRLSKIRKKKGISSNINDFGTTMIVCKMKHEKSHNNIASEFFHYSQTIAILPLKGGVSSVVITLPSSASKNLLSMNKNNFNKNIFSLLNGFLGKMKLISNLHTYPMLTVHANQFFKDRFALIGDSAVGMHPVTAHGFNLNLRGIDILTKEIKFALKTSNDIGSSRVLNSYQTKFRRITIPIYLATNSIVKLYTNQSFPAKIARKTVLRLGNVIWPIKNAIIDKLLIKNT